MERGGGPRHTKRRELIFARAITRSHLALKCRTSSFRSRCTGSYILKSVYTTYRTTRGKYSHRWTVFRLHRCSNTIVSSFIYFLLYNTRVTVKAYYIYFFKVYHTSFINKIYIHRPFTLRWKGHLLRERHFCVYYISHLPFEQRVVSLVPFE